MRSGERFTHSPTVVSLSTGYIPSRKPSWQIPPGTVDIGPTRSTILPPLSGRSNSSGRNICPECAEHGRNPESTRTNPTSPRRNIRGICSPGAIASPNGDTYAPRPWIDDTHHSHPHDGLPWMPTMPSPGGSYSSHISHVNVYDPIDIAASSCSLSRDYAATSPSRNNRRPDCRMCATDLLRDRWEPNTITVILHIEDLMFAAMVLVRRSTSGIIERCRRDSVYCFWAMRT
ncbi:hypothetical protein ACHAXA_004649 [Cyclostephanos tholiformis]|uniref:Uncharacterized protein n=1 Tax=Cyclostephanos tholiformis TaxID=382380 RepID=A0ABD3RD28_9STRA